MPAAACSTDSGPAPTVTEMIYVDADGNTVAPPAPEMPEDGPRGAPAPAAPGSSAAEAPVIALQFFTTPDGQIYCGVEPAGSFGNQDARPDFACVTTTASIPKPVMSNCVPNITRLGGAGALGPGWVATGVCTGGWFFRQDSSQMQAAEVGQRIAVGDVTCTVEAADAVQCSRGAEGFRLSSSAISVSGNDVTVS
ncbi:hypothetical protein GOHSU_08_00220 [Gordonia hirsuta DSM 44140 = NBRC 16056]|uniref:Uncharacterized protein n=2 Tax=Gordonia hirsuta TaxID=53427 RepID=L7L6F6_9ACTN|nr:hypothetical protein GOHSU_08_00220 [Gordonia hirsuta DSM 44140 = NBRC 16056]